ncbi:MAG: zinc ribbon domain-containing protein [Thermoplasmata archaeon]
MISEKIISSLYYSFALEVLGPANMRQKGNGRKFRIKLGSWSPAEQQEFIEYKAGDAGMTVLYVNSKHTSQKCSRCSYTDK